MRKYLQGSTVDIKRWHCVAWRVMVLWLVRPQDLCILEWSAPSHSRTASPSATRRSHEIYEFECCSTYIGRTESQLAVRIAEHVPRWLKERHHSPSRLVPPFYIFRCSHVLMSSASGEFSKIYIRWHLRWLWQHHENSKRGETKLV